MKERIVKIIRDEGISSSAFADILGIQRSSISHILSGRNKPSLDVIQRILRKFPNINSDWLILGIGDMYKSAEKSENTAVQTTLFDEEPPKYGSKQNNNTKETRQSAIVSPDKQEQNLIEQAENIIKQNKQIEKIVIFYTDKTFDYYLSE